MTYRADIAQLAEHLAQLLSQGADVPPEDLDHAVWGHAATLTLLTRVCWDTTGVGRHAVHLSDLDRDPSYAFAQLLYRQPRLHTGSVIDTLAQVASSPTGQMWRRLARAATAAHHEWSSADRTTRSSAGDTPRELLELAALSEAIVRITPDLITSLRSAGRREDALHLASPTGLGAVSVLLRRHLEAQRHPPGLSVVLPEPSLLVLPLQHWKDLPSALHRIDHMARQTVDLSPADVALTAQAVARTARATAPVLSSVPTTGRLAEAMSEQAGLLARCSYTAARLTSLMPGDPRPLQQAQEIAVFLASRERRNQPPPTTREARVIATFVLKAISGLHEAARRQINSRLWHEPDDVGCGWVPCLMTRPLPPFVEGLANAAHRAQCSAVSAQSTVPGAHSILAGPLATLTTPPTPLQGRRHHRGQATRGR